jgi:hypothetical protein
VKRTAPDKAVDTAALSFNIPSPCFRPCHATSAESWKPSR